MKNKFIITFSLILIIKTALAQQEPQFSQFMNNKLMFNPAFAGINDKICATLITRQQWINIDGAPKTYLLSADAPLTLFGQKGGLGVTSFKDIIGFEDNFNLKLAYAPHFQVGEGTLSVGLEAGFFSKTIDGTKFKPTQAGDALIPNSKASNIIFDLGFGAFYKNEQLYAGLSSLHLTQGSMKDLNVKAVRHYFLTGGYNYAINDQFDIQPNVLIKTDLAAYQFDVNANVLYNKKFWGGVGYRHTDAIALQAGLILNLTENSMLRAGYAYDMTTSNLKTYSKGTHELLITYCFSLIKEQKRTIYKNPRFL